MLRFSNIDTKANRCCNIATSRAFSDNGSTSGLHPEGRGSIPRWSTSTDSTQHR